MKTKTIIVGLILIVLGAGIYFGYDYYLNNSAKELMVEARMIYERGDKTSINNAIDIYTKIIAKYPESKYLSNAYFHIARCYEMLGLQRLAYLKYMYLIKNGASGISPSLRKDVLIRLAHIKVLKKYSEEAVSQLFSLLNTSHNREFRSRVYSELGHTYLKLRDYGKAKRMFDISMSEFGSNEEAILGKARTLKWMGKDDEAYDLYEHFLKYYGAVSQYTNDVRNAYREQAYYSGLNAFRKGQYWPAISYFARVIRNFSYHRISENALYWTGECYYGLGRFDRAISYFNRALTNGFYHKDEDARIKKGYSYFTSKRFDLAAREFQVYLQHYPTGKYAPIARNWKEMSTKELLFRIENKKLPDVKKARKPEIKEEELEEVPLEEDEELEEVIIGEDEEIVGDYYEDIINGRRIEFENVAEL